jgi:uracil-DNA glycosylase family 4
MDGRKRVLGTDNGPLDAQVMFVAEAPGRLGADRSGIPLKGDQSGRNFERLLRHAGLNRSSVFVTNAVLCNPRDRQGRNAPPSAQEIANCSEFLRETIRLIDPNWVITLGAVALRATRLIESHELRLSDAVGRHLDWYQRSLVPLYHPGPRAMIHRPFDAQAHDYAALGQRIRGVL